MDELYRLLQKLNAFTQGTMADVDEAKYQGTSDEDVKDIVRPRVIQMVEVFEVIRDVPDPEPVPLTNGKGGSGQARG